MKKTRTSSLWTAALSAVAVAGLFASCDKTPSEPVTPPVVWPEAEEGLANQYQFKNDESVESSETVEIKSVVYDYSEDSQAYLFVFSTVEGAEEVEATLKNDSKAFGVIVPTLDGAVDTTKTWGLASADQSFSVTYDKLTGNEHSAKLSFKLAEDGKLTASVEYIGETPETYFFLKYEGACTKQYHEPTLVNQMLREDRTVTDLKSLVIQTKRSHYYEDDNTLAFAFYREEGITADNMATSGAAPFLLVSLSKVLDEDNIDLATYKGGFTLMAKSPVEGSVAFFYSPEYGDTGGIGTLKAVETEDGNFSFEFNFSHEGKDGLSTVKAVYNGSYSTYVNVLGYSYNENTYGVPKNVFREKTAEGTRYVFGGNIDATTPEQLKEGDFAVSVTIPANGLGEEYELKNATECKVEFYDYKTYTTSVYDKDNLGAYGCVYVEEGEDDGKVFTQLEELEFADGVELDGSAYSTIVDATIPDLTPVKPVEPKILVTKADGTVLQEIPVTALEVAHFTDSYDPVGQRYSGYILYFRNASTPATVTKEDTTTPCFIIEDALLNCEDVDLTKSDKKWTYLFFKNTNFTLAWTGYGYVVNDNYGFTYYRCPDQADLTVQKNGKEWYFKFTMTDYGKIYTSNYWKEPEPNGTNNKLVIEYKGPATKCTGSDFKNDMTDQDY